MTTPPPLCPCPKGGDGFIPGTLANPKQDKRQYK